MYELFSNVLPDDLHSLFHLSRDIHITNLDLKVLGNTYFTYLVLQQ